MAVRLIESFMNEVERDPDGVVVVDADGKSWSRVEVLSEAARLAALLEREIDPNGAIMIHGRSGGGFWSALLAGFAAGRSVLPVGAEGTDAERRVLAEAHGVHAVIETTEDDRWTSPPDGIASFVVERTGDRRVRPLPTKGAACRLLLRSSGTTNRPGVARRSAKAIDRVASVLVERLGLDSSDVVHVALPMQHAYGMEHGVLAPIMCGARVRWTSGLDPMRGADAISDDTTVLPTVPAFLEGLARTPTVGGALRLVYTAGSPLPPSTSSRFAESCGLEPGDLYGMTEVGTIAFGSGGRLTPVDGVEVRVATNDQGVRESGRGELLVKSDAMFDGYVVDAGGDVDPGRRVDGFLRTGDLGEVDEAGGLRITGRAKVQFDVGGLKVNPEEIESLLGEHPDVIDIAVAPLRLTETVTRVRALVVIRDGVDPRDAIESLKSRSHDALAAHQRPRSIETVPALPRTATGKLRRGLLDSI